MSKAGSPEFFHHRIRGIPKSSHTFPPHKNPPSMMARWRAKWVLGMLWKITENPMAKAFRKAMSVWGCLMVDGLSCSREQKVFAGDGKSLSPCFCLYWPTARNLFLFAGINSLLKGRMSERTPLNNLWGTAMFWYAQNASVISFPEVCAK